MSDMAAVIVPRSDQWNYDDFLAGPITFKIKGVSVKAGQEQPVQMSVEGSDKFYRPCKSMARIFVAAWGPDSSKYAGRSITLYGDRSVKWGGAEVGGIRISHMSDIASPLTMALTMTKGSRKPYKVQPLAVDKSANPQGRPVDKSPDSQGDDQVYITPEQIAALETLCSDNSIPLASLKKAAGVDALASINATAYDRARAWVDAAIQRRAA